MKLTSLADFLHAFFLERPFGGATHGETRWPCGKPYPRP